MSDESKLKDFLEEKKQVEERLSELEEEVRILESAQKVLAAFLLEMKQKEVIDQKVFHFRKSFVSAQLMMKGDDFILLKGSEVDINHLLATTQTGIRTRRKHAIDKRILVPIGKSNPGKYRLVEEMHFTDPSVAASFVGGGARNGWLDWLNDNDKPLFNFKEKVAQSSSGDHQHKPVKEKKEEKASPATPKIGISSKMGASSKKKADDSPQDSRLLEEPDTSSELIESYKRNGGPLFNLSQKGVKAFLKIKNGHFVICIGSEVNAPSRLHPQYKTINESLESAKNQKRLTLISGGRYKVEDEFAFGTPEEAMKFILGGRFDSAVDWITSDGITLSEYMRQTGFESPSSNSTPRNEEDPTMNNEGNIARDAEVPEERPARYEIRKWHSHKNAYLEVRDGKKILCVGSRVDFLMPVFAGWERIQELREKARIQNWITSPSIGVYKTIVEIPFDSFADAAEFVLGGSRDGGEWVLIDVAVSDPLNKDKIDDEKTIEAEKKSKETEAIDLERIISISDFNDPSNYRLVGFILDDERYDCKGFGELPYELINVLNKRDPSVLERVRYSTKRVGYKKAFISKYTYLLASPREVSDGVFIEMEGQDSTMLERTKKILANYHELETAFYLVIAPNERYRIF